MQCFVHDDKNAAGVCKHCGKAVCHACAQVFDYGVACSEACATRLGEQDEMTQRALRIYGVGAYKTKVPETLIWNVLFGLIFIGFGVYEWMRSSKFENAAYFLVIGGFICLVSIVRAVRRKSLNC